MTDKRAQCACGEIFEGIDTEATARLVVEHVKRAHPDKAVPPIAEVIKHIRKSRMYGPKASVVFLLYPRDAPPKHG
jgi:hypothetical protein